MTGSFPVVLGVREASKASGLPRDLLYQAAKAGRLRVLRRGKRILIPAAELQRFVEAEAS